MKQTKAIYSVCKTGDTSSITVTESLDGALSLMRLLEARGFGVTVHSHQTPRQELIDDLSRRYSQVLHVSKG